MIEDGRIVLVTEAIEQHLPIFLSALKIAAI
jgi:hypothetical protein